MIKAAIVGNIASGKTSVESIIRDMGYNVFDTDEISHEILEKSTATVKKMFPDDDIITDNKIDRKKLGNIVFADKKKMKVLELIIHPQVVTELLKIFNMPYEYVFVSVPQLFEAGFEVLFDIIIFVSSDEDIRLKRLIERSKLSKEDAIKRISAQLPEDEKLPKCNYIIKNNGSLKALEKEVEKVISNICSKA